MKPKPASLNISDSDDNHLPGVEQLVKAVESKTKVVIKRSENIFFQILKSTLQIFPRN